MNSNDSNEHHTHASHGPTPPPGAPVIDSPTGASQLAVHGDPSVREQAQSSPDVTAAPRRPTVTWVHPSDLPRAVAMPAIGWGIGRGVDLQVALTRTALRAPVKAGAALGRRAATARDARRDEPASPMSPSTADGAKGVGLP
ncbi:hypothetical protein [Georgenia subflava]|uniref:Uncharacterized protein n=1 Tax=Georgenia subflava TaxID=1622177 RepID=A0A6N7EBZ8_9MICO|nr:hypothetical protein [Georgenia subflava]MPV35942.1 hypothetical protein [Georgenia subflava]